jgi:hypothetical protein
VLIVDYQHRDHLLIIAARRSRRQCSRHIDCVDGTERADGEGKGNTAETSNPPDGVGEALKVPPSSSTRSRIPAIPNP